MSADKPVLAVERPEDFADFLIGYLDAVDDITAPMTREVLTQWLSAWAAPGVAAVVAAARDYLHGDATTGLSTDRLRDALAELDKTAKP